MEINKPISAIIILIIALIIFFLFALPEYQKSNDLQYSLAQKQAEYNSKSVYYSKISELIGTIEDKKDALGKINSALPPDFSFAPLVFFFQKKGVENGLTIKSIIFSQISPETAEKKIRNITFTVNILGNYQGLKNFLSSLDKSARLFEGNSISFSPSVTSSDSKQSKIQQQAYDLKLELQTHTY